MKSKIIFAVLVLFCATNLMAQEPNQARWAAYVNELTNINSFFDKRGIKRTQAVMQNNELERDAGCTVSNIYENPLLLNGKILDYGTFGLASKGLLTVVKGNPETAEARAIPFYISIRRDGKIVDDVKMIFREKKVYKIELSDIFLFCKPGDQLIIKPANPEDWRAKRILKLLGEDGC